MSVKSAINPLQADTKLWNMKLAKCELVEAVPAPSRFGGQLGRHDQGGKTRANYGKNIDAKETKDVCHGQPVAAEEGKIRRRRTILMSI